MRQPNDWIRYPVSVMAIVQTFDRSVDGKLEIDRAAGTEKQFRAPALVNRPIAQNPCIGPQDFRIFGEIRGEMRRARFLFTFKDKTEVDDGFAFADRSASSAASMAMIGALSSPADRA